MAITRTLIGALPYCKDGEVEKWEFLMKYEEGEGSTYFTINFPVEIYANEPMADGTTTPHFTPKAEALWTLAELMALCPTDRWDAMFATRYDKVITNPPSIPEPEPDFVIPLE